MVDNSVATEDAMRAALGETRSAIRGYATACRTLRRSPAAAAISEALDLSIQRLDAMHNDLDKRLRLAHRPDALFISLQVLEAGLSSLTDSVGEMRATVSGLLPHTPALQGWFDEEGTPGIDRTTSIADDVLPSDATR